MLRWGPLLLPLCAATAWGAEWRVGGPDEAFATVGQALDAAQPGDVVIIAAGTYEESGLESQAPDVTLRADGAVILTNDGRVLRVKHPGVTLEGLILDAQHGDGDALQIRTGADRFTMIGGEVRNAGRDCVDMGAPRDVRLEGVEIHHCLASSRDGCDAPDCRQDAHAIVHGPARNVLIKDVVAHTFSGDAWQADPGRDEPGWTDVVIEGCTFRAGPLPAAVGGFAAGVNPAENAIDTKVWEGALEGARLTIRDTVAHGFRGGLIGNMAAFNLKERVDAELDGITVFDSEIAFRLRGETDSRPVGAGVTIRNAVVHDVDTAVRYEDDIRPITLEHVTFGAAIGRMFQAASVPGEPTERLRCFNSVAVSGVSGCQMAQGDDSWFGDGYALVEGSPAVDAGEALAHVTTDRIGAVRPQGDGWDLGAFELAAPAAEPAEPADPDPMPAAVGEGEGEVEDPPPASASAQGGGGRSASGCSQGGAWRFGAWGRRG